MPRTKFQSVVFTAIMVFCMVYCMTVVTVANGMGGLEYSVFLTAIKEMWLEYVIVFVLIFFFISPNAVKLAHRAVPPEKNSQLLTTVATQSITVLMIVPLITLIATFIHGGFTSAWFTDWLETAALCLPAAFLLQVLYVGPFVRFIFRHIFPERAEAKSVVNA